MTDANLEQKGGGGIAAAVVAGLVLFALVGRRGEAAIGNGQVALPTGLGEVKDFSLGLTNQIDKKPGDFTGIAVLRFMYKGPAQKLIVGWGIRPTRTGTFGTGSSSWNQGQNMIERPSRAWGTVEVSVNLNREFTPYAFFWTSLAMAAIIFPNPDLPQIERDGGSVDLAFGDVGVWAWITSGAKIEQLIRDNANVLSPEATRLKEITMDANVIIRIDKASVFTIIKPLVASTQDFAVSFA